MTITDTPALERARPRHDTALPVSDVSAAPSVSPSPVAPCRPVVLVDHAALSRDSTIDWSARSMGVQTTSDTHA
ncbi:hypothetical protein [Nonomuraea turcica]|uniref:hypothetical protein n=1 Tax=Nonomuraea sp. G32 TaxID=3067274 RepID=UPI00273C9ADB|nr:hypothetical protein [Nonomuraea sp. G32]MDP4500880.1 hypothetical protein [Nonomuraea sp. G32]